MDDKIKPLELAIINKRNQRDNMHEQMKSIKKAHFLDILEASKDKEQARALNLTNEKGRALALEERLEADPEYQRYVAASDTLSNELELVQVDLGYEKRAFQVWYVENMKIANGVE